VSLAACGGSGGTHTLGGAVSGLRGTLVLENGSDTVTVTENGPFAFPEKLPDGRYYRVRVKTPPRFERCTVANGEGTVRGADPQGSERRPGPGPRARQDGGGRCTRTFASVYR